MRRGISALFLLVSACGVCRADHVGGVRLVIHEHDHSFQSDLAEGRGSWRLFASSSFVVDGERVLDHHSSTAWPNWKEESDSINFHPALEVGSYPATLEFDLTFWEGVYPHFYTLGHSIEFSVVVWEPGLYTLNLVRPDGAPDVRATVIFEVYPSWVCRAGRCAGGHGPRFSALLRCGETDSIWVRESEFRELGPGYRLDDFIESWENLSNTGYRLVDAEVYTSWAAGDRPFFLGRFERGSWNHAFHVDHSLIDIVERTNALEREGYLLVDLESYDDGGDLRFLGVYREMPGAQVLRYGRWVEFARDWEFQTESGALRLTEIESFVDEFGERMFVGVYQERGGAHGLIAREWPEFAEIYEQSTNPGARFLGVPLEDIESYPYAGGQVFLGVYLQRESPAQTLLVGHDHDDFFRRVEALEDAGWSVEDFDFGSGSFPDPTETSTRCGTAQLDEPLEIYPLFEPPPEDPAWERPVIVGFEQEGGITRLRLDDVENSPWGVYAFYQDPTRTERPVDLGSVTRETIEWSYGELPASEGMLCIFACTCRTGEGTEPSCVDFRRDPPHFDRFEVVDDQIYIDLAVPPPNTCNALRLAVLSIEREELLSFAVDGPSLVLDRSDLPVSLGYIEITCRARSGGRETSARREFSFVPGCPEPGFVVDSSAGGIRATWTEPLLTCSMATELVLRAGGEELRYDVTGASSFELECAKLPAPSGEACLAERRPEGDIVETCATYACPGAAGEQALFDCNQDGAADISDSICMFTYLFLGGAELPCATAAGNVQLLDWNGDLDVDLSDPVASMSHFFLGGAPHIQARLHPELSARCFPIEGCPPRSCAE